MRHFELPFGGVFFALFLIGFSFLNSSVYGEMKPVELSYSTIFPAHHAQGKLTSEWAEEIEKRTNGRVKITIYWSGMLTPPTKSYDGVVKGISDIACSAPSYTTGRFPLTEVVELNLGFSSISRASVVAKMINEYFNKFKPKEFDGVKLMHFFSPGGQLLHTKKPVHTLEEFKGMKIRSNSILANTIKSLGGVPIVTPMSEAYETIKRGMAEGGWFPVEALQNWKLGELMKYTTECFSAANASSIFVVMNKNKWNALPPDVQEIIEGINKEWIEKTGNVWEKIDQTARDYLKSTGHTFVSLSDEETEKWRKGVRPILDNYVKNMKEKGLPGEEALEFCMDYLKEH